MRALPIDPPSKVIAVGLNYLDHAAESSTPPPETPILFTKWPSCLIPSGEAIVIPDGIDEVDWEAELAVVIARTCRDVAADDALDFVAGYIALNDVSARRVQRTEGQWSRAKSFDTFGPIGPRLVPAAEIADPQALAIRCRVNGDVMQDSNTSQMIFSVADLIAHISTGMTLQAGDLITTGTPPGVGAFREAPVFLQPGDTVEVEVEGIGTLVNHVRSGA
jgi:2-keto-4-pentenoate hydratase/2-oxohepta-3-ene-1,7-dioic acid hydratase in catechol pathway